MSIYSDFDGQGNYRPDPLRKQQEGPRVTREEYALMFIEVAAHLQSLEHFICVDIPDDERVRINEASRRLQIRSFNLGRQIGKKKSHVPLDEQSNEYGTEDI